MRNLPRLRYNIFEKLDSFTVLMEVRSNSFDTARHAYRLTRTPGFRQKWLISLAMTDQKVDDAMACCLTQLRGIGWDYLF